MKKLCEMNVLRKGIALLLAFCFVFSAMGTLSVFAAGDADTGIATNGKDSYFDAEGNALTGSSGWAVKISKMIETTSTLNQYKLTLTVDTKDKLDTITAVEGADIVMVFDVSTSMDFMPDETKPGASGWSVTGTRWAELKKAATTFITKMLAENPKNRISIVAYGGSNYNMSSNNDHRVICGWSNNKDTLIASYNSYRFVSPVNYLNSQYWNNSAAYKTYKSDASLRGTYFGEYYKSEHDNTYFGATNCEAGFYAADAQFDNAAVASSTNLKYVVYMSDGEANTCYFTNIVGKGRNAREIENASSWDWKGGEADRPITDAQAAAAAIKTNHPGAKIFTVGFGTQDTNRVLINTVANGNTSVNSYFPASDADKLNLAYTTIEEQIRLETKPWTVTDPMSAYVNYAGGLSDTTYAAYNGTTKTISWDIAALVNASSERLDHFTLSYLITLKDDNADLWKNGKANATNDTTKLVYKIVNANNPADIHAAQTVNFVVPTVKLAFHSYTFRYYYDGMLNSGKTRNETLAEGKTLDVATYKGYGDVQNYTLDSCTTQKGASGTPSSYAWESAVDLPPKFDH